MAIGVCIGMMLLGSLLGSLVGGEVDAVRYRSLVQPELTLPTAAFLGMSVLYYPIFGTVLYRVLSQCAPSRERRWILGLILTALVFNSSWNALVLDAGRPWVGFFGTAALSILVLALWILLARRDRVASLLLTPYLLWVGFDLLWSGRLWQLNPGFL
jgi:translocator protein